MSIDLALLLVAAGFGLTSLLAWRFHRGSGHLPDGEDRRAPHPAGHRHRDLDGVRATGVVLLAWTAFVVLTAGQVFGDLLMFAFVPRLEPRRYTAALLGSGRRRGRLPAAPAPALHALVGALAWFSMLAICLFSTVADAAAG